ncbi:MAG TPA: alpha/beta fold hydrolase [Hyphomicrobium sp.]|jgi:pimeloyl-ACP methyl ester carboxylesterase|nr:alpha/beta fold hydrolase [Hyphomicrobium sp.]
MVWLPSEIWAHRRFSGLPSAVAGDAAFRVFCTPSISERRAPNHRQLIERARYHLRNARWQRIATPVGDIQTYIFEPDRQITPGIVLIMHGWTGESSFMTAIAEAVRRSGFRVGLFDLPAHGLSSGRSTNLIDCARATVWVAEQLGPIHALVTHSFGGLISLVAAEGHAPMPGKLSAKHIALIASPNRLTDMTDHFSRHWKLDNAGRQAFEHRLERIGGRPLDCFAAVKLLPASGLRGLVIHAPDDIDVPFRCAEEIAAGVPDMELHSFTGLGHRNILFASPATRVITSYLKGTVQPAESRAYQPGASNARAASMSA